MVSTDGFAEIGEFVLGTDGSGAEGLIVKSGASRNKEPLNDIEYDENGNPHSSDHLFMDGKAIFDFTSDVVPPMIEEVLAIELLTKLPLVG